MKNITDQLIAKGYSFNVKLVYDSDREEFHVVTGITYGLNTKRMSPVVCTVDNFETVAAESLTKVLEAIETTQPPCTNDVTLPGQ